MLPVLGGARRGQLRRSLAASTIEGVTAEVVTACVGGAAITAWAMSLGCSTFLLGMLGSLPFLAKLLQLPGAWLTSRFGARRTALVAGGVSRQMFWPLVFLPWVALAPGTKQGLFVAAMTVHHAVGSLCNNAWVTWMADLVPARLRGRYFGRRTAICTLAGGIVVVVVGLALEDGRRTGLTPYVLSGTALLACVTGAVSTWLMSLKHDPGGPTVGPVDSSAVLRPLRDPRARRFLAWLVTWNAAYGLATPFFGIYLLRDLGLGFAFVTMHGAFVASTRMLSAPAWGRRVDRFGSRPVLTLCCVGITAGPLLWGIAGPQRVWPLVLDAGLSGVLQGGFDAASFALPIVVMPRGERHLFHAVFAMAGGAAYALAAVLGGTVAQAIPPVFTVLRHGFVALQVVFLLSFVVRLLATAAAWRVLEIGSWRTRAMLRLECARQTRRFSGELAWLRIAPPSPEARNGGGNR